MIKTDDITLLCIRNWNWLKTYYQKRELHNQGYVFDRKKKEWVKPSNGNDIETAITYCKKYGFQLVVDLPQYRRTTLYRKTFLILN